MTFIPGKDLGPVYKSLSKDEKKAIAKKLISYQKEEMNLNSTQKKVLNLYILIFCIIFMSERGACFNQDEPVPVSEQEKNLLIIIFEKYYEELK